MTAIRYPFEPVDEVVRGNTAGLQRLLNCTWQQMGMWRKYGLPWSAADKVAVALGFHPSTLWPSWFAPPPVDSRDKSGAHSEYLGTQP